MSSKQGHCIMRLIRRIWQQEGCCETCTESSVSVAVELSRLSGIIWLVTWCTAAPGAPQEMKPPPSKKLC